MPGHAWGMIGDAVSQGGRMQIDTTPMFARSFSLAGHVHRLVIEPVGPEGWEVREERDSEVLRSVRYTDWHRVERARSIFAIRASVLVDRGAAES